MLKPLRSGSLTAVKSIQSLENTTGIRVINPNPLMRTIFFKFWIDRSYNIRLVNFESTRWPFIFKIQRARPYTFRKGTYNFQGSYTFFETVYVIFYHLILPISEESVNTSSHTRPYSNRKGRICIVFISFIRVYTTLYKYDVVYIRPRKITRSRTSYELVYSTFNFGSYLVSKYDLYDLVVLRIPVLQGT